MIQSERHVESSSDFEPRGPPGDTGAAGRVAVTVATRPTRSPNATAALGAERRQLTVLFCDLVGSTELSTKLDPEDFRDVIGTYHRCVADTVREFDGYVALLLGDGAVVYFGYPNGHDDNAVRAIRAGLALVSRVGELDGVGGPLRVRIGVATGLVVVGDLVQPGAVRERIALGETPNLAARLQSLAAPDGVVIADGTRRLAGDRFTYQNLGVFPIKGFVAPVQVWHVTGAAVVADAFASLRPDASPRRPPPASVGPTPLVGRDQELGLLHDSWEQVTEGQGRVVLIMGDPGIGKTRLVQTMVADVADRPHVLLELRCSEDRANSPLYPVISLLWSVLGWSRSDSEATRQDKLVEFCERYGVSTAEGLPLLASLLSLPPSPRFPAPPMSPERQKQRTLQTLLDAVLAVAAEHPVLAVVEDLHWIDPTTEELLTLIVAQVATVRLLALLTARFHFRAPWQLHSHLTPIVLTRLTRRQAGELVSHVAGTRALAEEVVGQIVARADGVPLYVEELTKMVVETGPAPAIRGVPESADPLRSLAIPATLQDSLMARLDRLDGGKALAQLCATLGREFSYALLRAVSDLDDAGLDRELDRLVEAEFLYQRGTPPDATYVFKHALIREAAYESLLRSARKHHHRRNALAMVSQFASESAAQPEYVAMQFTEAGELGDAVRWWQSAGRRAFSRAAYAEAAVHFTKGLALLTSTPGSGERDQRELELQVELGYALIPLRGWAASETATAFTRAGELSRAIGETPVRFRALWGLGAFHFVRGDQRRAREVADQCLTVSRGYNDVDARIEAHYLSGIVLCTMGDFVPGQRELEASVRIYGTGRRDVHRVLYGQDAKASALGWLAMARWVCGRPDEALGAAEEGLAFIRDGAPPFLLARALAAVGFVRVFRGDPQGPDSPLEAAIALCAEQGFKYFHAVVSAFHGASLAQSGRAPEGIAVMQANVVALRTVGSELLFTLIFANLASALLAEGRIQEGLAAIDEGLACVERNGERWAEAELHRVRGQLLTANGMPDAVGAESCLQRALKIARGQGARAYELRAATDLAQFWSQHGKGRQAASLLAEILGAWTHGMRTRDLDLARSLQESLHR
jgi:class 3 adenylate cyclase/tetratricopeptide (TPR) repeat protein